MQTIQKFNLHDNFQVRPYIELSMPNDAQVISVTNILNIATLYAVVDTLEQKNVIRTFWLIPTGTDISSMGEGEKNYIGTVVLNSMQLVLHIFELIKPTTNEKNRARKNDKRDEENDKPTE